MGAVLAAFAALAPLGEWMAGKTAQAKPTITQARQYVILAADPTMTQGKKEARIALLECQRVIGMQRVVNLVGQQLELAEFAGCESRSYQQVECTASVAWHANGKFLEPTDPALSGLGRRGPQECRLLAGRALIHVPLWLLFLAAGIQTLCARVQQRLGLLERFGYALVPVGRLRIPLGPLHHGLLQVIPALQHQGGCLFVIEFMFRFRKPGFDGSGANPEAPKETLLQGR